MESTKSFRKKKSLSYIFILLLGLCVGWLLFHHPADQKVKTVQPQAVHKQIWTCSMHPQIRQDHPGKCPICNMDLIPVKESNNRQSAATGSTVVTLSNEAVALANIETSYVNTGSVNKTIRLFGKIQPDERLLQSQSAYVGGRIERLFINAAGDEVRKGQNLAIIYSPELYAAEQELVEALKIKDNEQRGLLVNAAKEKLHLWNLTSAQIASIIQKKSASPYVVLKSNTNGTVINKAVSQGDYVNQGATLLQIANLSKVWANFQAYEEDLPFIKKDQEITFTLQAMPGKTFHGRVSFIDRIINSQTRTAGIRVEISNDKGLFKPEMLITGNLSCNLTRYKGQIVVPKSAVLWTGKRSIVYVKAAHTEIPTFTMKEVILGPSLSESYVILSGLVTGDEVVTNGAFAIDASAQLDGKESMMNR